MNNYLALILILFGLYLIDAGVLGYKQKQKQNAKKT